MGAHHTEGLPDAMVEGTAHAQGDVPPRALRRLASELPACASPASSPWQVSRAAACSTSNTCWEEL
jgi:hypothetical protein